jgi:hypothetical protein
MTQTLYAHMNERNFKNVWSVINKVIYFVLIIYSFSWAFSGENKRKKFQNFRNNMDYTS